MTSAMRAFALGLLTLVATSVAVAAVPEYPCFRAETAPTLDGVVTGDPAWARVPIATGFSVLGGTFSESKQTTVQACWDDEALYVGVVCEEPDIAHMKLTVRDGGPGWLDDGLELFLQPVQGGQTYQFITTAGAARTGWEGLPDALKYQAAAAKGEDTYSLELRLPFALVAASPKLGDAWRANFCRNTFTTVSGGDKFTCWAPLKKQFLEPENYGLIRFRGALPSVEEARMIGDEISGAYRAHLLASLEEVAAVAGEYVPALRDATRAQRFRGRAARLRREWRELQQVMRDADAAGTGELRALVRGADALLQSSYDVKYAYLIAELLPE